MKRLEPCGYYIADLYVSSHVIGAWRVNKSVFNQSERYIENRLTTRGQFGSYLNAKWLRLHRPNAVKRAKEAIIQEGIF